jgi:hypothetical protein
MTPSWNKVPCSVRNRVTFQRCILPPSLGWRHDKAVAFGKLIIAQLVKFPTFCWTWNFTRSHSFLKIHLNIIRPSTTRYFDWSVPFWHPNQNFVCSGNRPDDGGRTRRWNIGLVQRDYITLYHRRVSSSYSPPWEPEISNSYLFIVLTKFVLILHVSNLPSFLKEIVG